MQANYHPVSVSPPKRMEDYLCRLIDTKGKEFYRVATWYGEQGFFFVGMNSSFTVTHWAELPKIE